MVSCFCPTLIKQIQWFNPPKTALKVNDLSSKITMTAHCFSAFSHGHAIGHCVMGWKHDLVWPDWLNWWVWPWLSAFVMLFFSSTLKLQNSWEVVEKYTQTVLTFMILNMRSATHCINIQLILLCTETMASCLAQSHYLNQCQHIVNWTTRTNIQWNQY